MEPANKRTIEDVSPTMSAQVIIDRLAAKDTFLTETADHQRAKTDIEMAGEPKSQGWG